MPISSDLGFFNEREKLQTRNSQDIVPPGGFVLRTSTIVLKKSIKCILLLLLLLLLLLVIDSSACFNQGLSRSTSNRLNPLLL